MMYHIRIQILIISILLSSLSSFAFSAELDVSELIKGLKQAIVEAQKVATEPRISMPWVEGEISYTLKKEVAGGFKIYVVTADSKYAKETVQRIKFRLEPTGGKPWSVKAPGEFNTIVVSGVDLTAGKIFVLLEGGPEPQTIPVYVNPETKIINADGEKKALSDIHEGTKATVRYTLGPKGEPTAASITLEPNIKNK